MQVYIPLFVAIVTGLITIGIMYVKDIYLKRKSDQSVLIKETLGNCYNPLYLKLLTYKTSDIMKYTEYINDEITPIVNKYGYLLTVDTLNLYINLHECGQRVIVFEGNITKIGEENFEIIEKIYTDLEEKFRQSLLDFVDAVTEEYGMYRKQYYDFYIKKKHSA